MDRRLALGWTVAAVLFSSGCGGEVTDARSDFDLDTSETNGGGSNSDQPGLPGEPEDFVPPDESAWPTETVVVNTLTRECSIDDNAMPDVRRLTNTSYGLAVARFTGYTIPRDELIEALPPQLRDKTITNVDFGLRVNRVYTQRVVDLAESVVQSMDWDPFFDAQGEGCASGGECRDTFVRNAFTAGVGRSPSDEEFETLRTLFLDARDLDLSFQDAAKLVVHSILASPQFLFVVADGTGDVAEERARRISLLLYDEPNHPVVREAVASGALDTREAVAQFVRSQLRDAKVSVGLEQFYYDWLNLDRLDYTIDLSGAGYERYSFATNDAMRTDLRDYLNMLVFDEGSPAILAFREQRMFVSPETAWIFGDDEMTMSDAAEAVDVSGFDKRVGLLTTPTMATLSLKIETKSIVDRGVFVNEHILCRDIPLPSAVTPIDETALPEDASQREKLENHQQGACASCHVQLDAPGYALEPFGPVGEIKTEDQYGNPLADDGTFEIDGVQKNFANVYEFSDMLAGSDELVSCMVERRLSHALARFVHGDDEVHACELQRLKSVFRDSNYDLRELTVGIATSSYFMN